MKLLLILNLVFLLSAAYARPCQVYGISDSPQKLDCEFRNFSVSLRCKEGNYLLNSSPVSSAFHLEVEEGSVPLVFKSSAMDLTVTQDKAGFSAEATIKGRSYTGSCL